MIWGQEAAENFKGVTPAARRRILCDNARAVRAVGDQRQEDERG
jgi:hypothetical protein